MTLQMVEQPRPTWTPPGPALTSSHAVARARPWTQKPCGITTPGKRMGQARAAGIPAPSPSNPGRWVLPPPLPVSPVTKTPAPAAWFPTSPPTPTPTLGMTSWSTLNGPWSAAPPPLLPFTPGYSPRSVPRGWASFPPNYGTWPTVGASRTSPKAITAITMPSWVLTHARGWGRRLA